MMWGWRRGKAAGSALEIELEQGKTWMWEEDRGGGPRSPHGSGRGNNDLSRLPEGV